MSSPHLPNPEHVHLPNPENVARFQEMAEASGYRMTSSTPPVVLPHAISTPPSRPRHWGGRFEFQRVIGPAA